MYTEQLERELGEDGLRELLATRVARCTCGRTRPSDTELPFFTYLGPGSDRELRCRICGFNEVQHADETGPTTVRHGVHTFSPNTPRGEDDFYCGCRGWE